VVLHDHRTLEDDSDCTLGKPNSQLLEVVDAVDALPNLVAKLQPTVVGTKHSDESAVASSASSVGFVASSAPTYSHQG
jgi:hypothetical protein